MASDLSTKEPDVEENSSTQTALDDALVRPRSREEWLALIDEALAEAKTGQSPCEMRLNGQHIGPTGACHFVEALQERPGVAHINLTGCGIGDEGACAFASDLIAANAPIQRLMLARNQITSVGASALAEALKSNTNLQRIGLNDNNIDTPGALTIAEMLKATRTLKRMGLNGNSCGTEGAKAIAMALQMNNSLEALGISANGIGADGARAFAEVLKANSTLQRLYMDNDGIGAQGAKVLAEALKVNSALQWLGLAENSIRTEGLVALTEALESNRGLHGVSLQRNDVSEFGAISNLLVAAHSRTRPHVVEIRLNDVLWKPFAADNQRVELMGSGHFGSAFQVRDPESGEDLVYKVQTYDDRHDDRVERNIVQMIPDHPHVMRMSHWCDDFSSTAAARDGQLLPQNPPALRRAGTSFEEVEALAVPLYEGGCLSSYMKHRTEILIAELFRIARQMASGIAHLHEHNIIHRDIALRNFVLNSEGDVVVIDFGLARIVSEDYSEYLIRGAEVLPWRSAAPETFRKRISSKPTDTWMFGLCLWELLGVARGVAWSWLDFSGAATPQRMYRTLCEHLEAHSKEEVPLLWPRDFCSMERAQVPSSNGTESSERASEHSTNVDRHHTNGSSHNATGDSQGHIEGHNLLSEFRKIVESCCKFHPTDRISMSQVEERLQTLELKANEMQSSSAQVSKSAKHLTVELGTSAQEAVLYSAGHKTIAESQDLASTRILHKQVASVAQHGAYEVSLTPSQARSNNRSQSSVELPVSAPSGGRDLSYYYLSGSERGGMEFYGPL